MKKRDFLKSLTTAAIGMPILAFSSSEWMENLDKYADLDLSTNEDFWEKVRKDYVLKEDYINLESGYYNIIPKPTLNSLQAHIKMVNFEGSYYMRTVQWDNKNRMVEKLASVVGCEAKNLIITRNTTESLDLIIKGFLWNKGDEAVIALQDYGAMKNMFEQIADKYGVIIKKISIPNHPQGDKDIIDLYANAITSKTKLVMVCHMINITGHILPIKKICDMAHSKGVQVMVDGAHCVGHFQFKIKDLNCDYYGSSLHKWLAVPLGTGMLYVKDQHINTILPIFAESKREPGDISILNHTGTHPVYHDLTIESAIEYYNMLGANRKENRLRYLQRYWTGQLRDHEGIVINTPKEINRSCGIANVGIKGMKPSEMAKLLLEEFKIFTVAIDYANVQGCRITPNVFTSTQELDVFVNALKMLAKK